MTLSQQMRDAAETLEAVSSRFGYKFPTEQGWSAAELRHEAEHVEAEGE